MEEEITLEQLEQDLKDIEESISNWRWYLKNGATNRDFCNEMDNLRNNVNYFLDKVLEYANQETLKDMENMENGIF